MVGEYYNHGVTNVFDTSAKKRDFSVNSSSQQSSTTANDSANLTSTPGTSANLTGEGSNVTSALGNSSAGASAGAGASGAAGGAATAGAGVGATGGAAAVTSAVTGGVVAVATVVTGAVAVPGLTPVQPTLDATPIVLVMGNRLSYSFNATYVSAGSLLVRLQNLEDDRSQSIDLPVALTDTEESAATSVPTSIQAAPGDSSAVETSADTSTTTSVVTSAQTTYHRLCEGYFDNLLNNKNYSFQITVKDTSGIAPLYSTTLTSANSSDNAAYTSKADSLEKNVSDKALHYSFRATYYQASQVIASLSDGADYSETVSQDLVIDSAHLSASATASKPEYTQSVTGDFKNLKPGKNYHLTLAFVSSFYPQIVIGDETIATLAYSNPTLGATSLYADASNVIFAYHIRYTEATSLTMTLDPTATSPKSQSASLTLDPANATTEKDGNGYPIYDYLFQGTFSGLTTRTAYPYVLHAKSAHYDGDLASGSITTNPDTIPVMTNAASEALSITNQTCIQYTFAFKYVEATDLKIIATNLSETHENAQSLIVNQETITEEQDSRGRSYYAFPISGSFDYLNPETIYTLKVVASSSSYSNEELFSGQITTLSSVKPSIGVSATPDYAASLLPTTLTINDPNGYLVAGKLYAKLVGTPTTLAGQAVSNPTGTSSEGVAGDYFNTEKTEMTRVVYFTEPYSDVQSLSLASYAKGYLIRLSIWGVSSYVAVGGSGPSSDPQKLADYAVYY